MRCILEVKEFSFYLFDSFITFIHFFFFFFSYLFFCCTGKNIKERAGSLCMRFFFFFFFFSLSLSPCILYHSLT